MKFLVLALCVCAASAATFPQNSYKPYRPVSSTSRPSSLFGQNIASAAIAAPKLAYEAARVVAAAPVVAAKTVYAVGKDAAAEIVRMNSDVAPDQFSYSYETSNSIAAEASGHLNKEGSMSVNGAYRYVSPEGVNVQFTYVADENGYQPQSDLLPVGPPIPEAILRSLEYLRTHAPANPEKYEY